VVFTNHVIQASDERVAILMATVNAYRLAAVPAQCAVAQFHDTDNRTRFETMWRDECYKWAYERRKAIVDWFEHMVTCGAVTGKMATMRALLPSREDPVSQLVSYVESAKLGPQYTLLKHCQYGTVGFGHLFLIPKLVELYNWLYDNLGHRLTLEDAACVPMHAVFTGARRAQRIQALYLAVCHEWNRMYDDLEGVLAVGACANAQRFLKIDADTPVGVFLTYPDHETNDVLIKVRRPPCSCVASVHGGGPFGGNLCVCVFATGIGLTGEAAKRLFGHGYGQVRHGTAVDERDGGRGAAQRVSALCLAGVSVRCN
jgi:hypothetical protein